VSNFSYSIKVTTGRRKLVDIDDFSYHQNKITFLFGESGIGKSIINKAIYGLLDSEQLDIVINGLSYQYYLKSESVETINHNGFFVFQEPSTHLNPLLTLNKQMKEGSLKQLPVEDELKILKYLWSSASEDMIEKVLKVFPKPHRPSGGEKQRILLAMAFKKLKHYTDDKNNSDNTLFVFDEPSGSLDNTYRNNFIHLLCAFFKVKPFTAIVITHDYSVISEIENQLQDFSTAVEYKELYRENGKVHLREFSKKEYLKWIDGQQKILSKKDNAGAEILRIKSGIKNFGMLLSFYQRSYEESSSDLIINKGDIVYLKAQSGVGKTTVAKIIMGLINPHFLRLKMLGFDISETTKISLWKKKIWGKRATMVFQHADEALNQNVTVYEVFKILLKKAKVNKMLVREIIQQLFEKKVPASFLNNKIKNLSGGQKQRINILRSLVLETDLLIMDEPLNGLDLKSSHLVIEKIKQHQIEGKSILMISHNEEIFDKIIPQQNVYYLKATELKP
jgi:peptide/nickel transport system ATP-binding protein